MGNGKWEMGDGEGVGGKLEGGLLLFASQEPEGGEAEQSQGEEIGRGEQIGNREKRRENRKWERGSGKWEMGDGEGVGGKLEGGLLLFASQEPEGGEAEQSQGEEIGLGSGRQREWEMKLERG